MALRQKLRAILFIACLLPLCRTSRAEAQVYLFNRADFTIGIQPTSLAVSDFNKDGALDLVIPDAFQSVLYVLLGKADGTFSTRSIHLPFYPGDVAVGDFNHDGKLDVAVLGSNGGSILLGNGDGTFQAPLNFNTSSGPSINGSGRFQGQG
jgi:hypothetical protein